MMAAELINIEIDFKNPVHSEILPKLSWAKAGEIIQVGQEKAMRFNAGAGHMTEILPYYNGKIKVEFDARTSDIEPNGEGWKVGAVQITYYKGNQGFSHEDLLLNSKKQSWQHYSREYNPSAGVTGFAISTANQGKNGFLDVKNLKISVELPGNNLLNDSSFRGMFGLDNWIQQRSGKDWDGALLATPNGKSEAVNNVFPGIGASAKLTNTATVISRRFEYNGESLLLGAWAKIENLQKGKLPWAYAVIQLVEYDADGKKLGHHDLIPTTNPKNNNFNYYQFVQQALSPRVKSLEVWLRIFEGATGTMTIDEVALVYLNEAGKKEPYDPAKGTITINANKEEAEFINPVWNGVDMSYVAYMGHDEQKRSMKKLKDAGMEYVRTREFMQAPRVLKSLDENGKMTFDFSTLDSWMDYGVLELGLKMVPTIETTPEQMATVKQGRGDANTSPPKDVKLWGKMVKEIVRHWIERYGKERVSEWVFECWNEPEASGFYTGTEEQFAEIFVAYLTALTELEDEYNIKLNIGTPSGASVNGSYFTTVFNAARKANLIHRMKSASFHIYAGFVGAMKNYSIDTATIRKTLAQYPEIKDPETHITEFNGSAMVDHNFDSQVGAAYLIRVMEIYLNDKITRSYMYCLGDHPYIKHDQHFNGDLGIITSSGIPKPVYNGFVLLNKFKGGKRLELNSKNNPFKGIAVKAVDGKIKAAITSFNEEDLTMTKKGELTIKIELPPNYKIEQPKYALIDSINANAYTPYLKANKPLVAEKPDVSDWIEASKLKFEDLKNYSVENNTVTMKINMENNSVLYIEL